MAATVASVATTFDNGVTSFAATAPSGSTSGQFLVAISFCDNDGSEASLTASGWTQQSSSAGTGPGTADTAGFAKLWSRTSDGSATYTFGSSASAASAVIIARVTGHNTSTPFSVTPVWSHPTIASATSLIAPTITAPGSPATGGALVCFWGQEGAVGGHTITKPASMTGTSNVDGIPFLVNLLAHEHVGTGATGTRTATASNAGNTSTQGYLTLSFVIADEASSAVTGDVVCAGTVTGVVGKVGSVTGDVVCSGTVSSNNVVGNVTGTVTYAGTVTGVVGKIGTVTGDVTYSGTVSGSVSGVIPVLFPAEPLPLRFELDTDGTWTDITSFVYSRDGIRITRGRPDEGSDVNPTAAALTLNNRDGNFSPRNPTGTYYGQIGRNTPLRIALREELGWLQVNQATGTTLTPTHVSTPDAAALDITGDLDIRFEADLDSWRDALELVSKFTETGNQRSYRFLLLGSGKLHLSHSSDGTSGGVLGASSTIPVPITSGRMAVRAALSVDNGSGERVRVFYIAPTLAGPWEQLGEFVIATGTTSIFASTATLHILDNPNDASFGSIIRGRVYGAQVLDGIDGTAVANPDFTMQDEGDTSFVDDVGRTWTLNGDLDLTNHDTRFIGEVSAWPQVWDTTGTDIYCPIVASGVLRRLLQGSVIGSALYRGTTRDTDVIAYWPMEDGDNSTAFGSALNGGRDIARNDTTVFSSDSTFLCSDPLPLIGQGSLRARVLPYPSTGEIIVQFLLLIPEAGLSATSTICTVTAGGTAPRWDLVYTTTAGGSLSLLAYDSDGTLIDTAGPGGFVINGDPLMVKIRLDNDGSDVDLAITVYKVGDTAATQITDTFTGRQIGSVSSVVFNPLSFSEFEDVVVGHLAVTNTTVSVWSEIDQINAWKGENATDRIKRLSEEENVPFCPIGPRLDGDSVSMGPQLSNTLITLLREAAESDGGILFEGREFLELRYRPRRAIQSQRADLTLDYADHQMSDLVPVEDDQLTRNDVTVSRTGGGSARAELSTGALSTAAPPAGVGRYDTSVSVSLEDDSTLPDQANWRVHLGTVDEARYPQLTLALESTHLEDERTTIHRIDLGDRLEITSSPAWLAQQDITQIVQGYSETMDQFHHGFEWNLSPASPWDVAVYDDHYERARYANGDCVSTEALDTTETGIDVLTGATGRRWSTTADDFDIMVGGEQMTVTSVSGTTKTQTLTVIRSVNGVVKSHASGVTVELFPLTYYGL